MPAILRSLFAISENWRSLFASKNGCSLQTLSSTNTEMTQSNTNLNFEKIVLCAFVFSVRAMFLLEV